MTLADYEKIWGNGRFCYRNDDKILEVGLTPAQSKKVAFDNFPSLGHLILVLYRCILSIGNAQGEGEY